jgi:hypothetical protein
MEKLLGHLMELLENNGDCAILQYISRSPARRRGSLVLVLALCHL